MIKVIRFNGQEISLNPDMILSVESTPDTVLTLTNGEKFVLKDKAEQVVERFIEYKRWIHTSLISTSQ